MVKFICVENIGLDEFYIVGNTYNFRYFHIAGSKKHGWGNSFSILSNSCEFHNFSGIPDDYYDSGLTFEGLKFFTIEKFRDNKLEHLLN